MMEMYWISSQKCHRWCKNHYWERNGLPTQLCHPIHGKPNLRDAQLWKKCVLESMTHRRGKSRKRIELWEQMNSWWREHSRVLLSAYYSLVEQIPKWPFPYFYPPSVHGEKAFHRFPTRCVKESFLYALISSFTGYAAVSTAQRLVASDPLLAGSVL